MKIIGLIVGLVKMILNIKKWITVPYRVWKMCRDRPKEVLIGILTVLVIMIGIWINVI